MDTVEVIDDQWGEVVGILNIFDRGKVTTYRYDRVLDGLTMVGSPTRELPPELVDVTPDRWGRKLVEREVGSSTLDEHVYLRYMSDDARPGSLRFRDRATGEFWGQDADIPTLLHAGDVLAEVQAVTGDARRRVSELIRIGSSSLGGARPKAVLRDSHEHLWVAKFAAGDDDPRTEAHLMQVARACGIDAAETRAESVANSDMVLSRRFDRTDTGGRIGMRSMRAAILEIGDDPEDADWVDLAVLHPEASEELFRRAAFGVLVNNTDDHARNHSELRGDDGRWHLSPAYDITTDPHLHSRHSLSVCGAVLPEDVARNLGDLAGELGLDRSAALNWVETTADTLAARHLLPFPELAEAAVASLR